MIRTDKGKTEFDGDPITLLADFCVIVESLRDTLIEEVELPRQVAERIIIQSFNEAIKGILRK